MVVYKIGLWCESDSCGKRSVHILHLMDMVFTVVNSSTNLSGGLFLISVATDHRGGTVCVIIFYKLAQSSQILAAKGTQPFKI